MQVEITRILPLYPSGNFLQWAVFGISAGESGAFKFDVYRGGSEEGPWTEIAGNLINTYNFLDKFPTTPSPYPGMEVQPHSLQMTQQMYYRVVAIPPSGAANITETVSEIEPRLDGRQKFLKRKILRDEALMLRKLNGVDVAVCKKLRWGLRCLRCWDKYTKESIRENCTLCYGTGFLGGYHKPVVTLAKRGVSNINTQLTSQGKLDTNMAQVTLLDVPHVEEEDLLVFSRDNRRFLVKNSASTELQTVTIHQRLVVSEISRSSIEYRFKVDFERAAPLF